MKNKSIISKVITGAIMAGMVISASTVAFADSAENTTVPSLTAASTQGNITTAVNALSSTNSGKTINLKDILKSKFDTLVTAGTITSDQETAILSALTSVKCENLNLKTQLSKSFSTAAATSAKSINIGIIKSTSKGSSDATVTIETADSNQGTVAVAKGVGPIDLSNVINLKEASAPGTVTVRIVKGEDFKAKLDALVTAGTITSDQEIAVLNLLGQNTNTTKTKTQQ